MPVRAPEPVDATLSPDCRVPGSKLYTLAPLRAVKRALKEHRAVKVLAIGSSSTVGVGASSPMASYRSGSKASWSGCSRAPRSRFVNRGVSGEGAPARSSA
jgi:hypothetical protein